MMMHQGVEGMTQIQIAGALFLIVFAFAESASAQFTERREFYKGLRYQAMGGAMLAVANDETALAANPAGLGRLRDFYGTIVDPEIELNTEGINAYNSKAYTDPFSLKQVVETMATKPNDLFNSRGQVMPSFVAKNFGIAILKKFDLQARAKSATDVDVFYRDDVSLLLGYNLRLFEGRIKIGVTGKLTSRVEVDTVALNPTAQGLGLKSLATAGIAKAGTGFGFDAGILLAAPWAWIPTIGAVYRDVGGTSFSQDTMKRLDGAGEPNQVEGDIDVGLALFPIHANQVRSSFVLEYRGLLTQSDEDDKAKLMHFGYELNFSDIAFLRAGYHQRYWTAGFEFASERMQFQVASYGEEVGTRSNPEEDRRWALKVAFRF